MNLTLKVTQKENTNMSSLVKLMCSLKCRIKVDSVNGDISIVDMDDDNVEIIIDSINKIFDITEVDIVPTVVITKPEPPAITEDSIEFEKLKFNNFEVQESANKLLRIIYWAMYHNDAKANDICMYLMTVGSEIAMQYNRESPTRFSIGDVVDCNYGFHVKGEVSGGHVNSIICDIEKDGMIYAVPIAKSNIKSDTARYLKVSGGVDIEYIDPQYTGGTVLLKLGKYIHENRVRKVVGHASPEFFEKVLKALPATMDFSAKYSNSKNKFAENIDGVQSDDDMLNLEEEETSVAETHEEEETSVAETHEEEETSVAETHEEEEISVAETHEEEETSVTETHNEEETSDEVVSEATVAETKNKEVKKVSAEEYLSNIFSDALNSLNRFGNVDDEVVRFLDAVDLPRHNKIIRDSFRLACIVGKIDYGSIIRKLHMMYPTLNEKIIKLTLREEFKKWLEKYPDIKREYPRISIMAMLKIYAKKMK